MYINKSSIDTISDSTSNSSIISSLFSELIVVDDFLNNSKEEINRQINNVPIKSTLSQTTISSSFFGCDYDQNTSNNMIPCEEDEISLIHKFGEYSDLIEDDINNELRFDSNYDENDPPNPFNESEYNSNKKNIARISIVALSTATVVGTAVLSSFFG